MYLDNLSLAIYFHNYFFCNKIIHLQKYKLKILQLFCKYKNHFVILRNKKL
jgi:hypothetical protein